MNLFEVRNNKAFPSTHALLIEPYKSIWSNDRTETKEKAIKYFTYIELVCSPKRSNPFYGYNEDERPSKVAKEVFGDAGYCIDTDLLLATMTYKEHLDNSIQSYAMLRTAEALLHRLRNFLEILDPSASTITGVLKMKPREILLAVSQIPKTMADLEEARRKVEEELAQEDVKTRNQRKIGGYEE